MTDDDRPMLMTELPAGRPRPRRARPRPRPPGRRGRSAARGDRRSPSPTAGSCPTGADRTRAQPRPCWPRIAPRSTSAMPAWEPPRPAVAGAGSSPARWAAPMAAPPASAAASLLAIVAGRHRRSGRPARARCRRPSTRWRPRPRYDVRPADGEIGGQRRVTFTNTTPDPAGQFSVFDEVKLAIHDAATDVAATRRRGRRSDVDRRGRGRGERRDRRASRCAAVRGDASSSSSPTRCADGDGPAAARSALASSSSRPGASARASEVSVAIPSGYEVRVDGDPLDRGRRRGW